MTFGVNPSLPRQSGISSTRTYYGILKSSLNEKVYPLGVKYISREDFTWEFLWLCCLDVL
jgi:hypothetical protein